MADSQFWVSTDNYRKRRKAMNDLPWSHKCSHDDEPIRRGDSVLAPVFTIVDDAHHSSADEEEQPQANLMSFVVVFAPGEGSGGKELVQLHAKSTGAVTIALVFPSPCALVYDHQGEELLALESPISIDVGAFVPRLPGFRLILSQLCGRRWEIGALTLGKRMARLVQAITESDLETAYAAIDLVDSLNMLVPGENREAPLLAAVKRHHRLGASAAGDGFVQYLLENGADPDFPSPDEIFHWSHTNFDLEKLWRVVLPLLSPLVTPATLRFHPVRILMELCARKGMKVSFFRTEATTTEVRVTFGEESLVETSQEKPRKSAKIDAALKMLASLQTCGAKLLLYQKVNV
ncbi:hypothetical protein SELMODRAFT_429804 [Selaginella moellendorffii]|uniref:DRBM domain-containing protein n=1 Tax=Selaginella moellendorffii TaxID=88036 RepID=D8T7C8_SELML|nr:hypothetical protein SELMODRAFT_429804 [Selaginella moellendorffii]